MTSKNEFQMSLFPESEEQPKSVGVELPKTQAEGDNVSSRVIPLELERSPIPGQPVAESIPPIPARWEDVTLAAKSKDVFPAVVEKLREVPAHRQLAKLISLLRDEGYVWVVFGAAGSGKSAFFQTLEYKFKNKVKTLIIDARNHELANPAEFSEFLHTKITEHIDKYRVSTPLIVVLEGREKTMSPEERSAISQTLKNILRAPGPGKNVIFVLPVNNLNHANLFIEEARETGVAVPKEGVYSFVGPSYTEHAEIVSDLFFILNGRNIEEYGILRSDLENLASSQQTIGEYIRTIRDELSERNVAYQSILNSYGYRPLTVIVCFVSPEPAYVTQRIIKGMTTGSFGHINPAEIVRVTRGNRARRWDNKGQVLARIVHALDLRVVEFPPDTVTKLFYAWGWPEGGYTGHRRTQSAITRIEQRLEEKSVHYNRPQSVRQNVRQQLSASNLFRIIAGAETRRIDGTSYLSEEDARNNERALKRRDQEHGNRVVAELACELARNFQYELHTMIAHGLEDALKHSSSVYPKLANWKGVFPETFLSFRDKYNREQRPIRPDIVIETQDRLYLLEFYWRNAQLSDAGIASYVLGKIEESYLELPMVKALENMDL